MPTPTKKTGKASERERDAAMKRLLEERLEDTNDWEWVTVPPRPPTSPTSVRLSEPLLKELDRLAKRQHRARGNLIQHILWEYVLAQRKRTRRAS